ncbi:glycoside hydrolase family 15 protein [Dactylosporangium siamense]|uniref:Glucoamylase n=1 Tax=Dactylosporangium siamense TaxID=685454 RepID=A0A919PKK3_9ACTN|nr:glycoside hydrolase family 15 protein [Dactylosporangium siamense]GIG43868.1 glucoamylase [Dactylosporangium siamense]
MATYPTIEQHGLIGDLQTTALVSQDGAVDWFCAPRIDSPSIFAALLDPKAGGHFKIAPEGEDHTTRQLYLPGTPVLITRFLSDAGVAEVVDFMPVTGTEVTDTHRLVRLVRVVRGQMRLLFDCQPRFNYGRDEHELQLFPDGAVFRSEQQNLTVHTAHRDGPLLNSDNVWTDGTGGFQALATLHAGEIAGIILETGTDGPPQALPARQVERMYEETRDYWRDWIGRSRYTGRWREMVERSAMTLKLLTYAPTGALVAAPTAGLPEQIGGERNWDYRYTWVRDASLSVGALLGLGYKDEAQAYLRWLDARVRDASERGAPLQIMYRVDGSPELDEEVLGHLDGYRDSRPVRVGNGAAGQLQLDVFGEALEAMWQADQAGLVVTAAGWRHARTVLDWLTEHWDQPEDGIWETRGGRQDFTYGRLMAWVAFDRAIRIAQHRGRPGHVARWAAARDAIYEQVLSRAYNEQRQAFVQHYASDVLDAALLAMPAVGFIAPNDPQWHSTLAAMDTELVADSLVYRYDPEASPDGLRGSEGTFTMCTFWYVDALARSGRLEDARLTFDKMLTYSNQLGLYAEEIAPNGDQIGNFPQAFSHLALINTAILLDQQLTAAAH